MLIACLLGEPVLGPAGSSPFFPLSPKLLWLHPKLASASHASDAQLWNHHICQPHLWHSEGEALLSKAVFCLLQGRGAEHGAPHVSLCHQSPFHWGTAREGKQGQRLLCGFVSWQKKPAVGFNWTVCGFALLGMTAESSPGSYRLPVVFWVKYE